MILAMMKGWSTYSQVMVDKYNIGQVAHDLRTPLNSFSLGLQAMKMTDLTEEQVYITHSYMIRRSLQHTLKKTL